MMLSILNQIALLEGLPFLYGDRSGFDEMTADVDFNETPIILYHEGFIAGALDIDQQGAFEPNYNLRLCLLVKADASDKPDMRAPRFEELEPIMMRILKRLQQTHKLTSATISEGINQTSAILDGIRFAFNARVKEPIGVCIPRTTVPKAIDVATPAETDNSPAVPDTPIIQD